MERIVMDWLVMEWNGKDQNRDKGVKPAGNGWYCKYLKGASQ